ncbi:MAG: Calx-beta domain-containing protein [Chloroflexota bacterium]
MSVRKPLIIYLFCLLLLGSHTAVSAAADIGYEGPEHRTSGVSDPTAEKPQSKLWFHDGKWYGNLFDKESETYRIWELDWETQVWSDTGVQVDDRNRSRADVLSDGNTLYIVSGSGSEPVRLYRFTYASGAYSLDSDYPIEISDDEPDVVVMDKDSTGTLWVTYVEGNKVYILHSDGADDEWVDPYVLPTANASSLSGAGDIATIVAYDGHVGVMWSHQPDNAIYFAIHQDGADDQTWQEVVAYGDTADDHVAIRSLQSDAAGNVFAVVKGAFSDVGDPQIIVLACVAGNCSSISNWESHVAYARTSSQNKTRPILLLDTENREVYVFVTTTGGGDAYYKKSSYDNISFPSGNGTTFIDAGRSVNNVTSTKQSLDATTGLVVMASSSHNYHHNCLELNGSGVCPDPNKSSIVEFTAASYDVAEGDSTVTITVERKLATDTEVSVDYAASDGTATDGADYDVASGSFTFAAGETEKTFDITLRDDLLDEEDVETVQLTLSNLVNAAFGNNETAVININDDDDAPTVQFTTATFEAGEGVGSADITVELSAPSGRDVTVEYLTLDLSAVAPDDYAAIPVSTLVFPAGAASQTFAVDIVDDALFETNETLGLVLAAPTNATLGTPDGATLAILDNEAAPTVQFAVANVDADEDAGTVDVEITLSSLSPVAISVDYAVEDGTAVSGSDYTAVAPGTVTFAPGENSKTLSIPVIDDAQDESDETIDLSLSNVVGADATLGAPNAATVTIIDDDDAPSVEFDPHNYDVSEGAGTMTATVTLSEASGMTVTVAYASAAGTAVSGSDYTDITGTVSFPPGETSQSIVLPILEDELDEADETVTLTIENPTNATLGAEDDATVTIEDNDDAPTVSLDHDAYQVREDMGSISVTITLSEVSGQSLSVHYETDGDTATEGGDYAAASGKLTFAPGETSKTVVINVFDDEMSEGPETAVVELTDPINVTLGDPAMATLTILDDDQPALSPDSLSYMVNEGDGTVTIELTLEYALAQPAAVDFETVDVDAEAGVDYTALSGRIVFAPGETSYTLTIDITEDDETEAMERFDIVFSNPVNMLVEHETIPVTIQDPTGVTIFLPIVRRSP